MNELKLRASAITEYLQEYAGVDVSRDRYNVGYLAAVKDLLNTSVEEISE
jgi:hypothetical protein